jgi:hypothetical protein
LKLYIKYMVSNRCKLAVKSELKKLGLHYILVELGVVEIMENTTATIEKLIEKAEVYGKTTLEVCKFNAIYKAANIFSSLAIRLILLIVAVLISLMLNIGLALYIGDYYGKTYYGFFIIALFYLFLGIIIYLFRNQWVKNPVSNFIISQSLREN